MQNILMTTFVLATLVGSLQAQHNSHDQKATGEMSSVGWPQSPQQPAPQYYPPRIVYDVYGRPVISNSPNSTLPSPYMTAGIARFISQHRDGEYSLNLSNFKRIDTAPAEPGIRNVYKISRPGVVDGLEYEISHNPVTNSFSVTVSGGIAGIRHVYVPRNDTPPIGTRRVINRLELVDGIEVRVTGTQRLGGDGQWHGNLSRQVVEAKNGDKESLKPEAKPESKPKNDFPPNAYLPEKEPYALSPSLREETKHLVGHRFPPSPAIASFIAQYSRDGFTLDLTQLEKLNTFPVPHYTDEVYTLDRPKPVLSPHLNPEYEIRHSKLTNSFFVTVLGKKTGSEVYQIKKAKPQLEAPPATKQASTHKQVRPRRHGFDFPPSSEILSFMATRRTSGHSLNLVGMERVNGTAPINRSDQVHTLRPPQDFSTAALSNVTQLNEVYEIRFSPTTGWYYVTITGGFAGNRLYRWKPTLKKQKAILGELVQTNVAAGPVYDSELANAHIAAGKLVLLGPPLPNPPWWNKYMQLLNAKGIERIVVSRPGVGLTQADHQYNTVMQTEIQRRFGAGILSKLLSEAKGQ